MANLNPFTIKNPTLKNIIEFLRNLKEPALQDDPSIGNTTDWYGRKNGVWSKIQGGGGGGESTNIGDEVYIDNQQLVIKSSSTEVSKFFGQIADDFNDAVSYSTGQLVMNEKELYRFTSDYVAGSGDSLTTHATTSTIDLGLQQKVNKSGDTITGSLKIQETTADISSTTATQAHRGYYFNDKNLQEIGGIVSNQNSGVIETYIHAHGKQTGSDIWNILKLSVNNDGTRSVAISEPYAWQNGLAVARFHISGTINSGNKTAITFSNAKIKSSMRVINCVFGTPANVTGNVSWSTSNGSVTFSMSSGSFTNGTTIDFDLIQTEDLTCTVTQ